VEHPAVNLTPQEIESVAGDMARLSQARNLAIVVLSATPDLGRAFVERMLVLNAATGALTEQKRGVLGRLFGR